jgi:hypothetical protein
VCTSSGACIGDSLITVLVKASVWQVVDIVAYVWRSVAGGEESGESEGSPDSGGEENLGIVRWWCKTH